MTTGQARSASRIWGVFSVAAVLWAGSVAAQGQHVHVCLSDGCQGVGDAFHQSGSSNLSAEPPTSDLRFFSPPFSRWFSNANAAGFTGVRGDAITLTYGVVGDGTAINGTGVAGENAALTSNLQSFLNTNIGSSAVWQPLIDDAYQRWDELSGLTMVRENNDDGATMGAGGALGQTGVRADMRIGGRFLDGQSGSNVLAYNYSPSNGDHVVDTGNTSFYSNSSNNYRAFRNVFMHEAGHGLGLAHVIPVNGSKIMEPFINTGFDGPQHDDILSIQRQYGDRFEENGGNDSYLTATDLGSLVPGTLTGPVSSVAVGTDADDNTAFVGANEIDFVSIDGTTDTDVYGFMLTADATVSVQLDPRGPTYQEGPQNGSTTSFNTKALVDLALDLLDAAGNVLLTADLTGPGSGESITSVLGAGDYFAVVRSASGAVDNVQLYELDISAVIPEPLSGLLLAGGVVVVWARRRRA